MTEDTGRGDHGISTRTRPLVLIFFASGKHSEDAAMPVCRLLLVDQLAELLRWGHHAMFGADATVACAEGHFLGWSSSSMPIEAAASDAE